MKWFGKNWGAPCCDEDEHARTPVGQLCAHCTERIAAKDRGFLIPLVSKNETQELPWHYECFMRGIIGSVSHQLKVCSCFDPKGTETDPPELSLREAAKLALELWEKQKP